MVTDVGVADGHFEQKHSSTVRMDCRQTSGHDTAQFPTFTSAFKMLMILLGASA